MRKWKLHPLLLTPATLFRITVESPRAPRAREARRMLRVFHAKPLILIGSSLCSFLLCTLGYLKYAPLPKGIIMDPSRILASDGKGLADLVSAGVTRQVVTLADIPLSLQEATVAIEDRQFYAHHGVNLKGITRALLANVGAGHVVQGGSTITQQLAKNLFLTSDRTLSRKMRELLLAMQLEWHYTKSQILSDYLNVIYYGEGATGIGTASLSYFGKPVSHLTLAESAMLAGLPKGPSLYDPLTHPKTAKERQTTVLSAMVHAGFITTAAARAAERQPLTYIRRSAAQTDAPYFVDAATRDLKQQFHLTSDDLYRGGLMIHTPLDVTLAHHVDQIIKAKLRPFPGLQAAVVVMDPQNGDILAYSGGRDYRTSPYDRAQAMRQPGSTFKAMVYAAALDGGKTPATRYKSAPTAFSLSRASGSAYLVHNFADDYAYHNLDMQQAIARSDNVYAVHTAIDTGLLHVIQTARALGLPDDMKPYPSLALGVFPVSTLQMARAYAAFANGGLLVHPHFVSRVTDSQGHVLRRAPDDRLQVLRPSIAAQMTQMLTHVMKPGGTGYRVSNILTEPVAAKTGTTDTDAWMVGYTPRAVCAVWVGFDQMRPLSSLASHVAAPIFANVMEQTILKYPSGGFETTTAAGIENVAIDPETGQRATSMCPDRDVLPFRAGTAPTVSCVAHPEKNAPVWERAWNAVRSLFGG
ncbi:transglycosylase domain-containing protein [Ferroacidibacillus organovorans]|uniref:Uncharacterized protein n=1 Tax=Ferroacidibacillus organovorans TaxID=1765683 RepID=A0A1V4EV62_9BACL|nr:PBP1A family penicillin-binding protein [Ferroacidibacillus organovorans]OPG16833.1 hypothetical protein B2M26_04300 [Ferroacidibacillus organovorans]